MKKARIIDHFEQLTGAYDGWKAKNPLYHQAIQNYFHRAVAPEESVIEFGCATGDLLAALPAKRKVGLDAAPGMIARARQKHPGMEWAVHDCELPWGQAGQFDVVIMADLVDHVTDIHGLFASANHCLKPGGRIYLTTINPLWQPLLRLGERWGMKMPEGEHNFVPNRYLIDYLHHRGFRLDHYGAALLVPVRVPLLASLANYIGPKLPVVYRLCVIQTIVARKEKDYPLEFRSDKTCTVVVPCYNEHDNIRRCIERIPNLGAGTEILVVDDGSKDGTADAVREAAKTDARVQLISYSPNHGKGYAVKQGFDNAKGNILMILDADMTVMPEDLPQFFRPLAEGAADFVNGTRMIYPMEAQSMRFLNLMGNFFFGTTMTWLVGQRLSDTLCGTKAFRRADYPKIRMGGDRWGDFDLLFGAAENGLKLIEVPVHYQARTEGVSKMKPFRHSLVLLKMCGIGFVRLKLKRRPAH